MVINGHNIYFRIYGPLDGPPVVLLHHGLGSTRAWRRQVLPMAEAGYRVIAYDRWGYGKSASRQGLSMPCFEDDQMDLLRLLDELKIERAALVGHSDGGTIALYFTVAHPERVACLVTLAAHAYIENRMEQGLQGVRQIFITDADFRRRFQRAHGDQYQQVFDHWFVGWAKPEHRSWDMRPVLGNIRCPTLVIQGMEDEHASPKHAEDIVSSISGAELWLLPGLGHMLQRDAAEGFNEKLLEFFERTTKDGGWTG